MSETILKAPTGRLLRMISVAKECGAQSEFNRGRHGAVLFTGNQVVYKSCNDFGPKMWGYDVPSKHAEASCLRPLYNQFCKSRRSGQRTTRHRKKGHCIL